MLQSSRQLLMQLFADLIFCFQRNQPELARVDAAFFVAQRYCKDLQELSAASVSENELLLFNKLVLPRFASQVIYFSLVHESIRSCPVSAEDAIDFWRAELKRFDRFAEKNTAFVDYWRANGVGDDRLYFHDAAERSFLKAYFACNVVCPIGSELAARLEAETNYREFVLSKIYLLQRLA